MCSSDLFPSHDRKGVLVSERERCEKLYHDNPKEWEDRKYLNRLKKQRQWTESKATIVAEKERKKEEKNKSSLIKTLIYSPIYISIKTIRKGLRTGTSNKVPR